MPSTKSGINFIDSLTKVKKNDWNRMSELISNYSIKKGFNEKAH